MSFASMLSFSLALIPLPLMQGVERTDTVPQSTAQQAAPGIAWQRSLEDALAVQKVTAQPLLIVVNSAGEVFNDRFRTDTYGRADFIASTRGYVCVIASPDRHNERDYDGLGNRIECPVFAGCTCGEHIAIEPALFARYFNGNRWAPRHLGVGPDGKILFDRFQDRSMQTAIDAIASHRGQPAADAAVPDDLEALLKRRDAAARRALEGMYRGAAMARRLQILAAAGHATNDPLDLLRMALRSADESEFEAGADTLARIAGAQALPDLEDAIAR
ncbi:MAG: hypothetical protein KDC98_09800, partial [Planctomycetes bacterium]|nr:hypothetical protein [Planctomycetota bacterium]